MKKKLIEVALPLEAINKELIREKSIHHGHPSTLHLWWARRPLAVCRAVLFASLVDDPSSYPEQFPTEQAQKEERQRLFGIIEELIKWENSNNEQVLEQARFEIIRSCNGNPPPVLDPFCGGGSIPLEAQRLGLEAHASDLNPVAVLITKALIEIPPKFAGLPPVNPEAKTMATPADSWHRAQGLAEDVRYYGKWMRDETEKRIGHLYPKVQLPAEYGGGEAPVIAWLWARTVKCPTCGAMMPLIKSFVLTTKKDKEAWIEPIINKESKTITFEVRTSKGTVPEQLKANRGATFKCLVCEQMASEQYIKDEGIAHRMDSQMIAIVAEGKNSKIYLSPSMEHEAIASAEKPKWMPEEELPYDPRSMRCTLYGLKTYKDLFTQRQLVALTTFSDLVNEVREHILIDANRAKTNDTIQIDTQAQDTVAYAEAVATYLGLGVSRSANTICSLATWSQSLEQSINVFSRQALPMSWNFPEVNPFASGVSSFGKIIESISESIATLPATNRAYIKQLDTTTANLGNDFCVFTDPPYYDNVHYADLSDFFYIWLRRSLDKIYPDLFNKLLTPKTEEIITNNIKEDNPEKVHQSFEHKFIEAFSNIKTSLNLNYPLTFYYPFKQVEIGTEKETKYIIDIYSTSFEIMLEGMLKIGLQIKGTWPIRTEGAEEFNISDHNSLASSMIIVCIPRSSDAPIITRSEFLHTLKKELPEALEKMQQSNNISPIDLTQISMGLGMATYSKYSKVLESDGSIMSVHMALEIINQALNNYLTGQEEIDDDTNWALLFLRSNKFINTLVIKQASLDESEEEDKFSDLVVSLLPWRNHAVHNPSSKNSLNKWILEISKICEQVNYAFELVGAERFAMLESLKIPLAQLQQLLPSLGEYVLQMLEIITNVVIHTVQTERKKLLDVNISATLEPSVLAPEKSAEIIIKLKNNGVLSLRKFQATMELEQSESKITNFQAGKDISWPITISPCPVGIYPIKIRWSAILFDGEPMLGEIVSLAFEVRHPQIALTSKNLGTSPYIVGTPIEDSEMFFGRHSLIDNIKRQLSTEHQANVILLEGNRRTGKSSILKYLARPGNLPGWIPVYCSLQSGEGNNKVPGLETREIFLIMARHIAIALNKAGYRIEIPAVGIIENNQMFSIKIRDALNYFFSGNYLFGLFEHLIEQWLNMIQPQRILLMIDEFDKLQEGINNGITSFQVPENIRYLFHQYSGLSGILAGSRRLKKLREEYWSALFGLGHRIGLGPLEFTEAQDLVSKPVEEKLVYIPEARDLVVTLCARQPYLIQSLCNRIFEYCADSGNNNVTIEIVNICSNKMVEDNEHFRTLWEYAGNWRRRFILWLCYHHAPITRDELETHFLESGIKVVTYHTLEGEQEGQIDTLSYGIPYIVSKIKRETLGDDIEFLYELELLELDKSSSVTIYKPTIPLMAHWLLKHIDGTDVKKRTIYEMEGVL